MRTIPRQLYQIVKELEAWQDEDRTITAGERSKEGPGWIDNMAGRLKAAIVIASLIFLAGCEDTTTEVFVQIPGHEHPPIDTVGPAPADTVWMWCHKKSDRHKGKCERGGPP